jgi:16S rRNA (cytosine1402-N4)-methyltransferase
MSEHHIPVMLNESLDLLITDRSGKYFDATLGFAGHTSEILKRLNPDGVVVATDVDKDAFDYCQNNFSNDTRLNLYNFNFSLIDVIAKIESIDFFDGIMADLGVSSYQLDEPSAGFAFRLDAALDLRMDKTKKVSAADILNTFTEQDLADIFYNYGEEKNSRKIAKSIILNRGLKKIESSNDLVNIISNLVPQNYLRKTLTRIFQALRIYVNDELEVLKSFLENSLSVLRKGGRLVVITYHSLEDRIVKEFFKKESEVGLSPKEDPLGIIKIEPVLKILTKKPLTPSVVEVEKNYRARSAKLRVAEKL